MGTQGRVGEGRAGEVGQVRDGEERERPPRAAGGLRRSSPSKVKLKTSLLLNSFLGKSGWNPLPGQRGLLPSQRRPPMQLPRCRPCSSRSSCSKSCRCNKCSKCKCSRCTTQQLHQWLHHQCRQRRLQRSPQQRQLQRCLHGVFQDNIMCHLLRLSFSHRCPCSPLGTQG